jgi:hypothetical protein
LTGRPIGIFCFLPVTGVTTAAPSMARLLLTHRGQPARLDLLCAQPPVERRIRLGKVATGLVISVTASRSEPDSLIKVELYRANIFESA